MTGVVEPRLDTACLKVLSYRPGDRPERESVKDKAFVLFSDQEVIEEFLAKAHFPGLSVSRDISRQGQGPLVPAYTFPCPVGTEQTERLQSRSVPHVFKTVPMGGLIPQR